MSTICGTPTYVAPEVITGQVYGKAVDMWSVGVILYILLSGSVPFDDESEIKLFKKIARGDYDLSYEEWQAISEEAKDLIRGLMCVDPKRRLTAEQALCHPWWALEELNSTVLQMSKLRSYVERLKMPVKRFRQGDFLVRQARARVLCRCCARISRRRAVRSDGSPHAPPRPALRRRCDRTGRGGRGGVPHQEGEVRDHG